MPVPPASRPTQQDAIEKYDATLTRFKKQELPLDGLAESGLVNGLMALILKQPHQVAMMMAWVTLKDRPTVNAERLWGLNDLRTAFEALRSTGVI